MKALSKSFKPLIAALALAACSSEPEVPELTITTGSLPDVALGAAYSGKIEVTGGKEPYNFAVSAGSLPMGVELNSSTGVLGGVGGKAGRASFTILVTDASKQNASADLSIYVTPDPLQIVTMTLPMGKEGTAYAQTLTARGGVDPLVWSIATGTLPAGVTLSADGELSGTPSEFGSFDFTVRVTDAEDTARDQALHLTLTSLDPMIVASNVPRGRQGEPYMATLQAEGGEPPYTWEVAGGSLPAGVALSATGELAGTPTESGSFTATILVRDSTQRMDMSDVTLEVIAPLAIVTTALPQAIQTRPYLVTLQASGGVPPYTWSLGSGTLPAGITLDGEGRVQGMSAMIGDYPLTIRVRDSEGFQRSALFELKVSDRFSYSIEPAVNVPAVCSSTTVSYVTVPIEVTESYQVLDVNVTVDVTYSWNNNNTRFRNQHDRSIGAPRLVVYAPDGTSAVLCGDGVDIPGGLECESRDMRRDYDDDGGQANRPERPLSVFDGMNARGTWTFQMVVAEPTCNLMGTINAVTLSIADDRRTDTYVRLRGFRKTNLVNEPWVRICTPNCGGVGDNELFLSARAYDVGPNGYPEGGEGDDVPSATPLLWAWAGAPLPGVDLQPDGHITTFDSGITTCGNQTCYGTGQRDIVASGGGLMATVTLRVLPPDWHFANREY